MNGNRAYIQGPDGEWQEIGVVTDGLHFEVIEPEPELDFTRTVGSAGRKMHRTIKFDMGVVCPYLYELLSGAPWPPPWQKEPPRVHPIDLEKVRWRTKEPEFDIGGWMGRRTGPDTVELLKAWPSKDHPFPVYLDQRQAELLDRILDHRQEEE